ncbi:LAMI_0C07228g1_1 [Lachancea mirantina]|uniref:LAMI_0C07228g1_1 n=1 Tax=Lachancea mirantina TaxID=1230905 RepID=A0A1G4J3R6_9SACH|nr:LAMI_0C07228g1_1 [Lachancea mirantina]
MHPHGYKVSPLDGIELRGQRGQNGDGNGAIENNEDELLTRQRNVSVSSLDSIKTAERLLDRLDLSAEDEKLLQQALEEERLRGGIRKHSIKRVVCLPASGFPSLRADPHSGSSFPNYKSASAINVVTQLADGQVVGSSKVGDAELHYPLSRYSYLVEEESEEEDEETFDHLVDIEQFRRIDPNFNHATVASHPMVNNLCYTPINKKSGSQISFHTPKGSVSSIETRYLIKPGTQSSEESVISRVQDRAVHSEVPSPVDQFQTPKKSASSSSLGEGPPTTPSGHSASHKSHWKQSSFSLKKLFKSPKKDSKTSLTKTATTTPVTVPSTPTFSFPARHRNSDSKSSPQRRPFLWRETKHKQFIASKDGPPKLSHVRALSDSNVGTHSAPHTSKNVSALPVYSSGERHVVRGSPLALKTFNKNDLKTNTPFIQDAAINSAIELMKRGNLKESAGQLKTLCDAGNPTGYLLYGLALRQGSGVTRNLQSSFLCLQRAAGVGNEDIDVFGSDFSPLQLTNTPRIPPEPLAPALYECGISYLKGLGVSRDEVKGLKYLEKAASLGHVDSMCLSGTIWSKKSASRKRDIARAAAWFRLADSRGATLIGAEWIYKDKYTKYNSTK